MFRRVSDGAPVAGSFRARSSGPTRCPVALATAQSLQSVWCQDWKLGDRSKRRLPIFGANPNGAGVWHPVCAVADATDTAGWAPDRALKDPATGPPSLTRRNGSEE